MSDFTLDSHSFFSSISTRAMVRVRQLVLMQIEQDRGLKCRVHVQLAVANTRVRTWSSSRGLRSSRFSVTFRTFLFDQPSAAHATHSSSLSSSAMSRNLLWTLQTTMILAAARIRLTADVVLVKLGAAAHIVVDDCLVSVRRRGPPFSASTSSSPASLNKRGASCGSSRSSANGCKGFPPLKTSKLLNHCASLALPVIMSLLVGIGVGEVLAIHDSIAISTLWPMSTMDY